MTLLLIVLLLIFLLGGVGWRSGPNNVLGIIAAIIAIVLILNLLGVVF